MVLACQTVSVDWRKNLGTGASVGCATPSREAGGSCSASHFLLLQMGSWQTSPWGLELGSKLDGSPTSANGYRHRCCLEIVALVGWIFCLPFTFPASVPMVFWLGIGGKLEHARQVRTTVCRADAILDEISRILSGNSKAAVAWWKDDMKNRGLAARWVKSRSIVGVDHLQHHVKWADGNQFERCLASVPLVPRATHLATAKELATRWNTYWS